MGWFSAIKRVFTHSSKQKLNESEKKSTKEKKKKNGFGNSFIPAFGEPSSIEKILGDVEREHALNFRPRIPLVPSPRAASPRRTASSPRVSSSQRITSFRVTSPIITSPRASSTPKNASPKVASARNTSPKVASTRITSPKVASSRITSLEVASSSGVSHQQHREIRHGPNIRNHHASAIRIQAAYRGYMARKSFRALKGLVRLQAVVRGQHVKRQTMNAMKQMQLLVRVHAQIHSQRTNMVQNQTPQIKYNKDEETTLGKWNFSQTSEAGNQEDWDDSLLTKDQVDAMMHRKMEATIKRQRATAYAYSQHSKSAQPPPFNNQYGRFSWSWNSLHRQMPQTTLDQPGATHSIPESSNYKQRPSYSDAITPMSTKSAFAPKKALTKQYPKHRRTNLANSVYDQKSLRDDESLMSCPPFSVPKNYLSPTMSTKAKSRDQVRGIDSKRRLSYPFTKGSNYNQSVKSSIDNMSVANSLSSVSTALGRKPFNRYV